MANKKLKKKPLDQKINEWVNGPIRENDHFRVKGQDGVKWYALGPSNTKLGVMICNNNLNESLRNEVNMEHPALYKIAEDFDGVNPFIQNQIRFTGYDLSNILSTLGYDIDKKSFREDKCKDGEFPMPYSNFNPYFVIDGKKEYYQRGYVWSLEQKQSLITSIYLGLDAGRIIVHTHSWKEQEKMVKAGFADYAARDVVDGKQRLSCAIEFIENKLPDAFGNYFEDLSASAQRDFENYHGFSFGQIEVPCTPKQIAEIFLNNAVAGTPLSKEHIHYMKSLVTKLNKA